LTHSVLRKVKHLYIDFNCICSFCGPVLRFPQPSRVTTTCLNADLVENYICLNPDPHVSVERNQKANIGRIMYIKARPSLPTFIRGTGPGPGGSCCRTAWNQPCLVWRSPGSPQGEALALLGESRPQEPEPWAAGLPLSCPHLGAYWWGPSCP